MKLPEYVSLEEVKRVCQELNFRDWTELTDPTVSADEASTILNIVNTQEFDTNGDAPSVAQENRPKGMVLSAWVEFRM